jgi:hypothetical protein
LLAPPPRQSPGRGYGQRKYPRCAQGQGRPCHGHTSVAGSFPAQQPLTPLSCRVLVMSRGLNRSPPLSAYRIGVGVGGRGKGRWGVELRTDGKHRQGTSLGGNADNTIGPHAQQMLQREPVPSMSSCPRACCSPGTGPESPTTSPRCPPALPTNTGTKGGRLGVGAPVVGPLGPSETQRCTAW